MVARPGVLPGAVQAPVLEARLAVERDLDLAVHAADQPQQHVVGVVVRGRAAVRVRTLVLVVPGPDQEHVAHDDPAAARAPARLDHGRAGEVAPCGRHLDVRRPEPERARVAVEDCAEHARASRSAAGRAIRRCRSAPRARRSRSPTGRRSPRSRGTGRRRARRAGPRGAHSRPAAAWSSSTVSSPSRSEPGARGSGRPEKARATASALSSPVTSRNLRRAAVHHRKRKRDPCGTSGAIPAVSTPTTFRSRSPSASSPGKSEQMWASGPRPSSIRSKASGPASSSSRS